MFAKTVEDVRSGDEDEDEEEDKKDGIEERLEGKNGAISTGRENGKAGASARLINGNPVAPESSEARTKEGETYADAIKEETKLR